METKFAPLFEEYRVEELAKALDRSEIYLMDLKHGRKPFPAKFKSHAALILKRPEAELFGTDGAEKGGNDGEPDSVR